MSNSIWHKPSETTDVDNNLIIHDWTNRTYELGYFDDNDMIFRNFRNDDTYFEESMMCWCDIDDLIAQADKAERLEKENEAMREEFEVWHGNYECEVEEKKQLQKAVDFAVDYLEQVATHAKTEEDNFAAQVIKRKIDEIKQLIKEQ